jgi:L-threonylcarbamoyladenylate synthase
MAAERVAAADPAALNRAEAALRRGEIVGLPTETVYGLAVVPTNAGLARLVDAKRRSADKGIALLVDSLDQVRALAEVPEAASSVAAAFWPGALTLVLPQRAGEPLPDLLTGGRPTIGVRLPDHDVPRALARRLGPIAVSSANISGEPDATTADQVLATLAGELALVIDDGPVRGGVPSTVVAISAAGELTILRAGAITEAEVRAAARK